MNNSNYRAALLLVGFSLVTGWGTQAYAHTTEFSLTLTCESTCNNSGGSGTFQTTRQAEQKDPVSGFPGETGDIPVNTSTIMITYTSDNFTPTSVSNPFTQSGGSPVAVAVEGSIVEVDGFNSVDGGVTSTYRITLTRDGASTSNGGPYIVSLVSDSSTVESGTYTVMAIPEPGTLSMFVAGLAILGTVARKNRQKSRIRH